VVIKGVALAPYVFGEGPKTSADSYLMGQESASELNRIRGDTVNKSLRHGFLCACMFFVAFLICAQNPISQVNWAAHQVTGAPTYEPAPRLGNDGISVILTYTSRALLPGGAFGNGEIFYQRLNEDGTPVGGRVLVASGPTDNELNDISGDHIVYTAYSQKRSLSGDLMIYRISTGERYVLAGADVVQGARICNQKVVWLQGPPAQVMIFDLDGMASARTAEILTVPNPLMTDVGIGDRFVVWTNVISGQVDVMAYDIVARTQTRVTATPLLSEINPATSGDWITWQEMSVDTANPPFRIIARNMVTKEIRVIAGIGRNSRPHIHGDLIGYESTISGNRDVFVHRLSTGATYQATNELGDQFFADTSDRLVAYVDLRNGSEDIFIRDLNSASASAPVDTAAIATFAAAAPLGSGGQAAANLDQGANGPAISPISPVDWENGNLNQSKSHYVEGFSIPYRITMTGLPTDGTQVTIWIGYDIKNSDKHAIDYLTSYNCLEPHAGFGHSAEIVNPVVDLAGLFPPTDPLVPPLPDATFPIPAPGISVFIDGLPQPSTDSAGHPSRLMSLWGGHIINVLNDVVGELAAKQSEATMAITFEPTVPTAVLAWGGHIAKSIVWGAGQAATGIQGSPYHMRLKNWNLGNLGNQDRSLSASAVLPTGNIVVKKVTVGADGTFDYSATGQGLSKFSLTTPGISDTQTFAGLIVGAAGGNRTVTEETLPSGWTSAVSITSDLGTSSFGSSGATATVSNLAANDTVTITFTNTKHAKITVIKDAIPSDAQDFSFTGTPLSAIPGFSLDDDADGTLPNTTEILSLKPGDYTITEGAAAGFELTGITGADTFDLATKTANISLAAGEEVTVTFTNTKQGHVTVVKTETVGGVPGSPTSIFTFELHEEPSQVLISQKATPPGTLDFGLLKPGTYSLIELSVGAGWHSTLQDQGGIVDPSTGNISLSFTLSAGEEKIFTIDNSRPGGGTRTIGYWKNWNSYSHNGDFVARAAQTGNFLADDFLPIVIGVLNVDSAQIATAVLSKTAVNGAIKNSANDAAYALAAQLLAAELNVKAGAAHSSYVDQVRSLAQTLLAGAGVTGFNGTGDYWKGGKNAAEDRQNALNLAALLDQYNNGLI